MAFPVQARVGLAPLEGLPTNGSIAALGLTATIIAEPTNASTLNRWRAVLISNLHASNLVAFTTIAKGGGVPTLTADAGANAGAIVFPGTQVLLGIPPGEDL